VSNPNGDGHVVGFEVKIAFIIARKEIM